MFEKVELLQYGNPYSFVRPLTLEEVNTHFKFGFNEVKGIYKNSELVRFYCKDGVIIDMCHAQDCCEEVYLEDSDALVNAEDIYTDSSWAIIELSQQTTKDDAERDYHYTWSFYKVKTSKGYDTIRWVGSSNGYYSETVDFFKANQE